MLRTQKEEEQDYIITLKVETETKVFHAEKSFRLLVKGFKLFCFNLSFTRGVLGRS